MTNQYLLLCPIEPLEEGQVIRSDQWPLHMTLLQWFLYEGTFNTLVDGLATKLKSQKPLNCEVQRQDFFGKNETIPVSLVAKTPQLSLFHTTMLEYSDSIDAIPVNPQWIGDSYRPHVTHQGVKSLETAATFRCESVCLIQKITRTQRKVIRIFEL